MKFFGTVIAVLSIAGSVFGQRVSFKVPTSGAGVLPGDTYTMVIAESSKPDTPLKRNTLTVVLLQILSLVSNSSEPYSD
jgi:hypothetical protein